MKEIEKPLKSPNMGEVVDEWDAAFVTIDQEMLFELILAANYMDIKSLLDLTCAKVASMIKGKTPEEIRKTFNIVNDFTPEEEAQLEDNIIAYIKALRKKLIALGKSIDQIERIIPKDATDIERSMLELDKLALDKNGLFSDYSKLNALFAGVRSMILWQQLGGSKLKLFFLKNQFAKQINKYLRSSGVYSFLFFNT